MFELLPLLNVYPFILWFNLTKRVGDFLHNNVQLYNLNVLHLQPFHTEVESLEQILLTKENNTNW